MKLLLVYLAITCAYISFVIAQASSSVSIESAPGYLVQRDCVRCQLWACNGGVNGLLQCDGLNYCYCRADLSSAVDSYLTSALSEYCLPGPVTDDISAAVSIYSQYCATALGAVVSTSQTPPPSTSTSAGPAQPASSTLPLSTSPESAQPTPSASPTITAVVSNTGSPATSITVQIETATASSNAQSSLGIPLTTLTTSVAAPSTVILTLHSTLTSHPAAQTTSGGSNSGGGSSLNGGEIAGIVIGIISALGTIAGVYLAWKLLKNGRGASNSLGGGQHGGRDLRGTQGNVNIGS